jgi:glutathione S-transferase
MRPYFYPAQHVEVAEHAADVKATAERRLAEMFERIDSMLGEPYALGDRYSAVDPYLMMLVRWTADMNRPARSHARLARHAERVLERPAVRRTLEAEGIEAPFV